MSGASLKCRCLLAFLLIGCSSARLDPALSQPRPARAAARIWSYEVVAGAGARELSVHAALPRGVPEELELDRFAHPYLRALELRTAQGWRPLNASGASWRVPECRASGCELRYRYLLGDAAEAIDRFGFAALRGGVLLAPPSTWLLHPRDYQGEDRYRLSVRSAPPLRFVSGVPPSPAGGDSREAPAELLFEAPYSAFGRFREQRVAVPGGTIVASVGLDGGALALGPAQLDSALRASARLLSDYYGRFPARELALIVVPAEGSELFGMQLGNGGASILLFVGRQATELSPGREWVLVHELFHLGFPTLPRRHLWLAEGLASYQEPLARARAGLISERQLWKEFVEGLPKGLPAPGDGGLDGTQSWGRTYWGGALFCLLADLRIRIDSAQRFSLDDALRGIFDAGGDTSARWGIAQTLAAGDRAVGGQVLSELYQEHAQAAVKVDLDAIFRRLGVRLESGQIVLDDAAEWANLRRALTAPAALQRAQARLSSPGVPKSPL
jgi:hypothetical protein